MARQILRLDEIVTPIYLGEWEEHDMPKGSKASKQPAKVQGPSVTNPAQAGKIALRNVRKPDMKGAKKGK